MEISLYSNIRPGGGGRGDFERVNAWRHRSIRRNWTAQNVVSYLLKRIHFSARWTNSTDNHNFCSVWKQKDVFFIPFVDNIAYVFADRLHHRRVCVGKTNGIRRQKSILSSKMTINSCPCGQHTYCSRAYVSPRGRERYRLASPRFASSQHSKPRYRTDISSAISLKKHQTTDRKQRKKNTRKSLPFLFGSMRWRFPRKNGVVQFDFGVRFEAVWVRIVANLLLFAREMLPRPESLCRNSLKNV